MPRKRKRRNEVVNAKPPAPKPPQLEYAAQFISVSERNTTLGGLLTVVYSEHRSFAAAVGAAAERERQGGAEHQIYQRVRGDRRLIQVERNRIKKEREL